MTAKEKAEELYKKMYTVHPNIYPSSAKQCALVAVDEIIKFISDDPYYKDYIFFEEVKQEIEKL